MYSEPEAWFLGRKISSGAGVTSSAEKVSTGQQSGTLPMIQIIWAPRW